MSTREVRLELLIGRKVLAGDGRVLGRIEEVYAERVAEQCFVREYHVGPAALLERLAVGASEFGLLRLLGARRREPLIIPADRLDLTDPAYPRLSAADPTVS
jgi:hypothetical protein